MADLLLRIMLTAMNISFAFAFVFLFLFILHNRYHWWWGICTPGVGGPDIRPPKKFAIVLSLEISILKTVMEERSCLHVIRVINSLGGIPSRVIFCDSIIILFICLFHCDSLILEGCFLGTRTGAFSLSKINIFRNRGTLVRKHSRSPTCDLSMHGT